MSHARQAFPRTPVQLEEQVGFEVGGVAWGKVC